MQKMKTALMVVIKVCSTEFTCGFLKSITPKYNSNYIEYVLYTPCFLIKTEKSFSRYIAERRR